MAIRAKAVLIKGPGGPENLALGEIDVREPGPTEVLIAVAAAGLNRADVLQRKGVYPAPPGVHPDVPGLELAGVIEKVGSEVTSFKLGERVMCIASGAAMATHVVMHERELLRVPEGMSVTDAAAIPEVFMTAFDALFVQGELALSQHALIHAVGSGVGTAALQLVLAAGAIPIGTSRKADKLERCKALGLVHGVVSEDGLFADQVKKVSQGKLAHVVLDTIGAKYLGENVKAVAPQGRIIVIGLLGGDKGELPLGLLVSKRATVTGSVLRSRPLEEKASLVQRFSHAVLPLFTNGRVKPVVDAVMPMASIQDAHRRLESDETFGKIVMAW